MLKYAKFLNNVIILLVGLAFIPLTAFAEIPTLTYTPENQGLAPIPPAEQNLQTITAEPYFKVSDEGLQLEGPAFDTNNNLFFVEVFGGRVFKLTPDKELSTVLDKNDIAPAGISIHKDGRLFIAGLGNFKDTGSVVAINPDGTNQQVIVPADKGYLPDDLVFDDKGGFYFTDFRGTSTDTAGGVYYVSPDFKTITPVLPNLSIANGISLDKDDKTLWVTEFGKGLLHRVLLSDSTEIAPFGATVSYHFTGNSPDSTRTDVDGNVYVAMYGQGRVMVFNQNGLPIGQILVPGSKEGHNLRTTSMAFIPGTNKLLILTNDWDGGEGSNIYIVKAFANGTNQYSHE